MKQHISLTKQLEKLEAAHISQHEKLVRLLQIGCEKFEMMLGLISKIRNGEYFVFASYPEDVLENGVMFNLEETICDVTTKSFEVTSFAKASGTKWASHPAYDKFSIESYIGTAYQIRGKIIGTVNFSSPSIHNKAFTFDDDENLKKISACLERILTDEEHFIAQK